MMNEFAKTSYFTMKEELVLFSELGIQPIRRLAGVLNCINDALNQLRTFLKEYQFKDQESEIYFFKYDKPKFFCEQIYAKEIYTIEIARPHGDELLLKNFYEQELKYIKRFFIQYQFLYQYYQLDASDLDHLFFVRGAKPSDLLLPETPDLDPLFSTSCDYLFSKFMAYEKIQDYLINCLYGPIDNLQRLGVSGKNKILKWTGNKADLVELAYGIYDTLQINNGDVDIADIIDWLEKSLQINLGRYYQCFSEIKNRKSISKTHFLDHMLTMLSQHIEEGDAFKPRKPKNVSGSKSKQ